MPQDFAQLVRMLRDNASDGAARIARQAVSMLRDFVIHAEGDADLSARTRACAEALAEARPEMAAIGNLVRYWAASFSWPEEDFRACAISHCEAILARADRALAETVANARRRLVDLPATPA